MTRSCLLLPPVMRAALRSLALGLIALAALASAAAAKPKVAILGLEVVGELDPDQTRLAKQLTGSLRDRASAGSGPYDLAAGEKELVDEKLMNNCESEALSCMAPIGLALAADFLIYGKIEKIDRGYHLTIKLLRLANKLPMQTYSEIIPVSEIRSDLRSVAKRVYSRLTASDDGTVTIRVSNVDRATVYIDDQPMGTTSSGILTIPVPEGRRRLAVVATEKGWRRHEQMLKINAGDSRNIPIELARQSRHAEPTDPDPADASPKPDRGDRSAKAARVAKGSRARSDGAPEGKRDGGGASGGGRAGWRVLFAVSIATALGGGGGVYHGYQEIVAAEKKLCTHPESACSPQDVPEDVRLAANERGNRGKLMTEIGGGFIAAGVLVGAYAFYKGFVADAEKPSGTVGRSTRPRRTLVVTPVIAPSGGGATLRFDW